MTFIIPRLLFAAGGQGGGYIIEGSGLFDGSSGYLSRTPVAAGSSNKIFTIEAIFKPKVSGVTERLAASGVDTNDIFYIQFESTGQIILGNEVGGTTNFSLRTTPLFRDPSAYAQLILAVDTSQATASNRAKLYWNGTRITDFSTETYPALNLTTIYWNQDDLHHIGATSHPTANFWSSYIARFTNIDGQALDPTSFGETTSDGFWQINDASDLTFGNNGFLIEGGTNVAAGVDSQAGGTPAEQQVVALLHMDGDDAATTFTDSSSYTQTFTAGGNTQIDTAQYKFGSASGLFDGTGDTLQMTASPVFALGTAWTAEGWFRQSSSPANGHQAVYYQGNDDYVFYARASSSTNNGVFFYFKGTAIRGTTDLADDTWHHWAMVRDGSTARAFIDGTSVGTASPSWVAASTSDKVHIGAQNSSNYFKGHMDEVRVTMGLARYTGNFTAPSAAFTDPATANHFAKSGTITATNDSPTNGDA